MKKTIAILLIIHLFGVNIDAQINFGYGLEMPDPEDEQQKNLLPTFVLPPNVKLPSNFDLSSHMPPVGNQGSQPTCVAFAIGYSLKSYHIKKQKNWQYIVGGSIRNDRLCSPYFINNMAKNKIFGGDCSKGIKFSEGFKILKNFGVSYIADFPHTGVDCHQQPNDAALRNASKNKIAKEMQIDHTNIIELQYNLYVGNPIVVGIELDDFFQPDGKAAFRNKKIYIYIPKSVPNPKNYHALLCVGYDDKQGVFKLLNSWGSEWGNAGYVDIPYDWFVVVIKEAYVVQDN